MTDTSPESSNTDTLPSTNASITASLEELTTRPVIKRARPQLSCIPCRQGKLKCNRLHPICDQCQKRSREASCSYLPPPTRQKQTQNMKGRIKNLESLVVTLMNSKDTQDAVPGTATEHIARAPATGDGLSQPSPSGDTNSSPHQDIDPGDPNPASFGQLRITHADAVGGACYVGAAHWTAILNEIAEVKNYLDETDELEQTVEEDWDTVYQRSTITLGAPKPVSKASLIAQLPPKEEVDRLLPFWFNSSDPLLYMIHAPNFRSEYAQFWKDPFNTPTMWIALLYGSLALAIILGPRNSEFEAYYSAQYDKGASTAFQPIAVPFDGLPTRELVDKYQNLAASAIALADIARPQPYIVEAAMIHIECEFLRRTDHHVRVWFSIGLIIRIALRMGYHRDASHFKNMPPFQVEMRRRIWHILYQMDILVSFALGLPSMLRRIEADTRAPHNLYDTDFTADCDELPEERPPSELTPGSYFITKSRLCAVFAEAAELWQSIIPPSHSDIMAVDARLLVAYEAIPEGLRVRSMGESIADTSVLIMSRFNLELLYLKTRTVLHRKYITAGRFEPRLAKSRKICVEAAMATLRHHSVIFNACLPGGQLHKVWWYMASLTTYDFLLAAMIVVLELNHIRTTEASPMHNGPASTMTAEMVGLLEKTYGIWAWHPNRIAESGRACGILREMLTKIGGHDILTNHNVHNESSQSHVPQQPHNLLRESISVPDADGNTGTFKRKPFFTASFFPDLDLSNLEMPDVPGDIDWNIWDNALKDVHPEPVPNATWPFDFGFDPLQNEVPLQNGETTMEFGDQDFDLSI
ncbi:uncharacterized protein BDZ99DRAFT_480714 [Mytilinidion resinicola]|uniref:Zn(2)-C6 fungal-type domain-containing protein n=1 Tax=Mytilinidion resinicola TaxID=574789 RepID=A0A6A6Y939_9PEZI|nr:uncharacterized protein BDZ99DRAFT_480714 [Mytilinidion resinicola]KAF2805332.1 hypothetical protein BDZ99DRAFT_480714 [Mytilinidion resinicola]